MYVIPNFLMNSNGVFRQFTMQIDINIFIYHHKFEFVYYTFIRYRAMFFFIQQCTRLLPNKIHSVNVKYMIIDYKVKFLRYTRTYSLTSLSGSGRGVMIFEFFQNSLYDLVLFRFSVYIFYFVSFLSLQILFRFVVFRFVVFRFASLCFVSHYRGALSGITFIRYAKNRKI